ncbi:MAG TPA: alcohol dehydrogenase, partial [Planctomycetaceae bacterium]|nr:alcohol dehydrogenase [Planctomycetaceae bacterium]
IANEFQPDVLIGLGGGSSMDCAKGINFLYTNGGEMKDYWGIGKASQPMLPMVAIPTTAGTGSETQSFALISDAETHVKMACGDKKASCKVAILDPTLTTTQPKIVTAVTGIDAIAHALETHVTTKRNNTSLAYSQEAWLRLASNFTNVLGDAPSIESREQMQLGACLAGMAIEHSMLGATHALANPLTAKYGIIHGQAIAIMLPHVIRFNADEVSDQYEQLLQNTASTENMLPSGSVENLAQFVESLVMQSGLSTSLAQCGVEPELLPALAEHAAEQWTGQFNPRKVEKEELLGLYKMAYE